MSLILAINTASQESALALIEGNAVLGEESWLSQANESERLIPCMEKLLELSGKTWKDLTGVFVVKGPGSYTSLRVGITVANSLAWSLKIPMRSLDVFELWEARIASSERVNPHRVVMAAGRDRYFFKGEDAFHEWAHADETMPVYGEPPLDHPHCREVTHSFGEALVAVDVNRLETVPSVEPLYTHSPHITVRKKA